MTGAFGGGAFSAPITIHDSIYKEKNKTIYAVSMGEKFKISYVENAVKGRINPGFPAVHISTDAPHDAWVQVIYTDHKNLKFRFFLDSADQEKYPNIHPFYTKGKDFYEAPMWRLRGGLHIFQSPCLGPSSGPC